MSTSSKPGAVLGAENRSRSPTALVSALEGISVSCGDGEVTTAALTGQGPATHERTGGLLSQSWWS